MLVVIKTLNYGKLVTSYYNSEYNCMALIKGYEDYVAWEVLTSPSRNVKYLIVSFSSLLW